MTSTFFSGDATTDDIHYWDKEEMMEISEILADGTDSELSMYNEYE